MTRALAAAAAVLVTLVPGLAAACPACISSPYGDRSYNWAYVGLLLAPFLVAVVIGSVLAWSAGYRLDVARLRRALSLRKHHLHGLASPPAPRAPGASASHAFHGLASPPAPRAPDASASHAFHGLASPPAPRAPDASASHHHLKETT